jgi:hypothetical protein
VRAAQHWEGTDPSVYVHTVRRRPALMTRATRGQASRADAVWQVCSPNYSLFLGGADKVLQILVLLIDFVFEIGTTAGLLRGRGLGDPCCGGEAAS